MFFCQSASVVSSTGAAEAMPALEMQMSTPPNFQALSRKPAITASSRVTSTQAAGDDVGAVFLACSSVSAPASASRSMSQSTTQAPSSMSRRAVARPMPPAPPVISATRPASGFRLRHALQLGFFEIPVFDVEGFLLGQAAIVGNAGGAAHHVDGVDVELAGDARRGLVGGEGDHAHAGHQVDHRIRRRASSASPDACSARSSPRSARDRPRWRASRARPVARRCRAPDRRAAPAARSWCAGSDRGRKCRAPRGRRVFRRRRSRARSRCRRSGRPWEAGCSPSRTSRRKSGRESPA